MHLRLAYCFRNERIEQNGIAHFLEHMAFKGTKTRSALQIAEAIEDVGGYINAYTSREMTAYYARVLQGDVALALIGPGIDASHNYERAHMDGLNATTNWILAYLLDE